MSEFSAGDTTRPSDEFLAAVRERLAAQRRDSPAAATAPSDQKPALAAPALETSGYQRAAAVLAWFEPHTLRPMQPAPRKGSLEQLFVMSAPMLDKNGVQRWALLLEPRIAALRELRQAGLLERALEANKRPDDPLQHALEGYIFGGARPVESQTLPELAATYQAAAWLGAAGFEGLPAPDAIARRTNWLRLIQPFEHLASDDEFRGRVSELQQLRAYAGVLPPGSVLESARRTFEAIFNWSEKPPLLISGPGGVGKSTLAARFILEHARAHEQDRFPFVYLDFDRPEVDSGEPLTLLTEAVRQLGVEYPEAREGCERLRSRWIESIIQSREQIALESMSVQSGATAVAALTSAIHEFASLVATVGASDRPVLFVLDTFEEVQWQSVAHVENIWSMLQELQGVLARLRVVIVGRAEIEGRRTQSLSLSGLDEEAAIGYLRARGIADEVIARRVARQIGGSPLSLKLAAELAQLEGLDNQGRLAVTTHEFFFLRLDNALLQRQIYKRILTHVHDEDVRKLAHPGLVLRRITPDLILKVLAEPCGIRLNSPQQAQKLFDELKREVSLVTTAADGSLRHRQDLRVVMIELLRIEDAEKVKNIHQRAVAYYETRPEVPAERAEEIYHRLQLDEELSAIDPRWIDGVERYLASAVEEFSGRRRAYLASHLGTDVDEETRQLADLQDWEKITGRRAQALLTQDQPRQALELMRTRTERSKASPLVGLEARALARLEDWDEAFAVIDSGFERAVADGERSEALALALQAAELVLTSLRVKEAARAYACIAGIEALSKIQQLEAAIRMLAMVQLDPALAEKDGDLRARFTRLFDALTDQELRDRPGLGSWAASVFEPSDATRLARVIALCGLPRNSETDIRQLAGELASLDAGYSSRTGQPAGALAHEFAIAPQSSLTGTWSEFLLRARDDAVRATLASLLRKYSDLVSVPLIQASASLMLASLGIRRDVASREPADRGRRRQRSILRATHRKELADALAEAFSFEELSEFIKTRLGRNIEALVPLGAALQIRLLTLIDTAQQQGWVLDLVAQAYYAGPDNPRLAALAAALGITGFEPTPEIEAVVPVSSGFLNRASSRERLDAIAAAACRVEIVERFFATGFLVGADLLLTAGHVIADIRAGTILPSDAGLRFDYREAYGGALTTSGTVFRLARSWLVASENAPAGGGLNYALLRVDGAPGVQPIGAARAESTARLRGWIEVPERPAVYPGTPVLIMGHPGGEPLRVSVGQLVGLSSDGAQLTYDNATTGGLSGAPCFNADLQLIGVHFGADRKRAAFGAAIDAIVADLDKKGFADLLRAKFA